MLDREELLKKIEEMPIEELVAIVNAAAEAAARIPDYTPACIAGYEGCISDPAYIKCYYPEWYEELYGDMPVEEVAEECRALLSADGECRHWDDEDK